MKTKVSTKLSGQVEWFKDMAFILARGAVKVVRKGEGISMLKEEDDQIISFTLDGSDNEGQ